MEVLRVVSDWLSLAGLWGGDVVPVDVGKVG